MLTVSYLKQVVFLPVYILLLGILQDNAKSTADLSKTLETTRAHLQGQLRGKEAENNRLSVQIKVCHEICFSTNNTSGIVSCCLPVLSLHLV